MTDIILVPGTYHGGWYFDPIVPSLTAAVHRVFAPTLTGLDPDAEVQTAINLDMHVDDILRIIEGNNLREVLLVGWSYGGMVITGVADKFPNRIATLIYLDGQLPKSGQREWDLLPPRDRKASPQLLDLLSGLSD